MDRLVNVTIRRPLFEIGDVVHLLDDPTEFVVVDHVLETSFECLIAGDFDWYYLIGVNEKRESGDTIWMLDDCYAEDEFVGGNIG